MKSPLVVLFVDGVGGGGVMVFSMLRLDGISWHESAVSKELTITEPVDTAHTHATYSGIKVDLDVVVRGVSFDNGLVKVKSTSLVHRH